MKSIKGNILTEKGVLKVAARTAIASNAAQYLPADFMKADEVNSWYLPYSDSEGNIVYAVFSLTVSQNIPTKAVRKPKAKADNAPADNFDIE